MSYGRIAEEMSTRLSLTAPPIALAFVERRPEGIREFDSDVPSACTLWRRAESEVFYASAERHFNCPIGAMTMGFELTSFVQEQLTGLVGMMCECRYLSQDEPAKIPSVEKDKNGIVYGPLADFPLAPDVVLIWLKPSQAMLFGEAMGSSTWSSDAPATVFGRPACAALPVAFNDSRSALSMGCTGMRTFTEVGDDRMLAVLSGSQLDDLPEALGQTLQANAEMKAFYRSHKAQFA